MKLKEQSSIQLKLAPSNILAEQALLAAIIIDLQNMRESDVLNPADFYDSRHRQIFTRMKELYDAGKAIDLVSFAKTEFESYILELLELPQGLLNVKNYISEIKKNSIQRQRLELIDDFAENKITYEKLINSLQKIYTPKKELVRTSELVENIKPILEKNIFGIKIQYGAIFILAGATSAGKTEFALEIADVHANQDDCISIYCIFEGGINEFGIRLKKKNIYNENLFMLHNPDIADIRTAVDKFKDRKVLVIIDYLQMFARRLQANDDKPADFLRKYTSYIYMKLDEIKTKYNNVCFGQLSSLNNAGIGELRYLKDFDDTIFLKSLKEDGNIQFDSDYIYSLLFADEDERKDNKWALSRKKLGEKMRKYILLHPAKPSRIGEDTKDALYVYDAASGRYNRLGDLNDINEKNFEIEKNKFKKAITYYYEQ